MHQRMVAAPVHSGDAWETRLLDRLNRFASLAVLRLV